MTNMYHRRPTPAWAPYRQSQEVILLHGLSDTLLTSYHRSKYNWWQVADYVLYWVAINRTHGNWCDPFMVDLVDTLIQQWVMEESDRKKFERDEILYQAVPFTYTILQTFTCTWMYIIVIYSSYIYISTHNIIMSVISLQYMYIYIYNMFCSTFIMNSSCGFTV